MSNICSKCFHFLKESREVNDITQNTYIEQKDPDNPEALLLTIAQCNNESTTNEMITRDSSTDWFFSDEKYSSIFNNEIVVAGENDACANFKAIV